MNTSSERLVTVFSTRELIKKIYNCWIYEFEDIITSVSQATIHSSARLRHARSLPYVLERTWYKSQRALGRFPAPPTNIAFGKTGQSSEIGLFIFNFASQISTIKAVPDWREMVRLKVCYLGELWPQDFSDPKQLANLKLLGGFDAVFSHCSSIKQLESLIGRPCYHLPVGVDALRFCPPSLHDERPVDIYSLGRRSETMHRKMLHAAKEEQIFYLYDTASGFDVMDYKEHRELVASVINRSKFFVSYKHNHNLRERTSGQEELGARQFEGAAGGTVLLGSAPDCEAQRTYFNWPDAIVEMPFEHGDPVAIMRELCSQPDRLQHIRTNNVIQSLLQHDWAYRWEFILDKLSLPHPHGLTERKKALGQRAERLRYAS